MKETLITVVVPIYNTEKYLKECLNSITNQTYKNIEIILVNDGSTDSSQKICEEFLKKDKRIILINKDNGGLSDARNTGIDRANGEYIAFIDSDDYIEPEFIEKLYDAIIKNDVKISQCGIKKVDNLGNLLKNIGYAANVTIDSKEMIKDLYRDHYVENIVVWNKMYKITLFDDIRYPKGKIHEDEFITYKIIYEQEKIAIVNDKLYNYRQSNDSIMGKNFNKKRLDALEALEERIEFFKANNETELYELSLEHYLNISRDYYMKTRIHIENSKKIQKTIAKRYRKYYRYSLKGKSIKFKTKIKMLVFYISPSLHYRIKNKN